MEENFLICFVLVANSGKFWAWECGRRVEVDVVATILGKSAYAKRLSARKPGSSIAAEAGDPNF